MCGVRDSFIYVEFVPCLFKRNRGRECVCVRESSWLVICGVCDSLTCRIRDSLYLECEGPHFLPACQRNIVLFFWKISPTIPAFTPRNIQNWTHFQNPNVRNWTHADRRINSWAPIPKLFDEFSEWEFSEWEYEFGFTDIRQTLLCFRGADSFIPRLVHSIEKQFHGLFSNKGTSVGTPVASFLKFSFVNFSVLPNFFD